VFPPFSRDSDAFGSPDKSCKINLLVADLNAMVEQLRAAGVAVAPHPGAYPNRSFAGVRDPEGNRAQFWEPDEASPARDPARRS
jgi:glyoxylase I family protein